MDGSIIDFFGGAGSANFGHGNPDIIGAPAQIDDLTHTLDIPSPPRGLCWNSSGGCLRNLTRCLFGGPTGSGRRRSAMKLASSTPAVPAWRPSKALIMG
jgi:4-aminobutyrate aminotransferase-like enzyme